MTLFSKTGRTAGALFALLAALPASANVAAGDDDAALIEQAFYYTFPLYRLAEYRWTALETRGARTSTTLNRFAHARAIATPTDRWANAPIVDALYSTAWLDLAQGPVRLDTPDTAGRYTVLTLIDCYANTFFYAGARSSGSAAQHYWLVGPGWQGEAPAGTTLVRAPTNDVYVNLRVAVDGPADQAAANRVQDGFTLSAVQPVRLSPRPQPRPGDAADFVDQVNRLLALDPPPERDRALLARWRQVGLCGSGCSWAGLAEAQRQAWRARYPALQAGFMKGYLAAGAARGWIDYSPPGVTLGTPNMAPPLRASSLALGMGMLGLAREEANYWTSFSDATGQPLDGAKRYRLHLPPGGIPAQAFWSVSLYAVDPDGQFLAANPLNRYHLGSRSPALVRNADGSIDLWLQPTPPSADKLANWLPTPDDGRRFSLFARAYIPSGAVLAGTFRMPPAETLD